MLPKKALKRKDVKKKMNFKNSPHWVSILVICITPSLLFVAVPIYRLFDNNLCLHDMITHTGLVVISKLYAIS